jgi:hypothetical protein
VIGSWNTKRPRRRRLSRPKLRTIAPGLVCVAGIGASCGSGKPAAHTTTTIALPTYTAAQKSAYFRDLERTDPTLTTYVTQHGQAVLVALLADGAGFCEFVAAGQDLETAVSNLQTQAQQLESNTGLPASLTTCEIIGTDALIALCPSEQSSLSSSQLAQLQQVEHNLAAG